MKYIATPYTLTFVPANDIVRMKAMQLLIDAAWSAQWDACQNEQEGWVRHCRLKLESGHVTLLVRHYQTKEENWAVRINCNDTTNGKFVVRASSKKDLEEIWKVVSNPRPGRFFDMEYLTPRDIQGGAVFSVESDQ